MPYALESARTAPQGCGYRSAPVAPVALPEWLRARVVLTTKGPEAIVDFCSLPRLLLEHCFLGTS